MAGARKAQYGNGQGKNRGSELGFEATLWQAADTLRSNMDAGEYKHVVLGLIFLKYVSDAFEERHQQLEMLLSDPAGDDYIAEPGVRYQVLEDRDEYIAEHVFWVPPEARWSLLQAKARQPEIGVLLDDAMTAIEREN